LKDFAFVSKEKFTNLIKRLDETEKDEDEEDHIVFCYSDFFMKFNYRILSLMYLLMMKKIIN
jgi:predicted DNA binding CopG/RHH family protein